MNSSAFIISMAAKLPSPDFVAARAMIALCGCWQCTSVKAFVAAVYRLWLKLTSLFDFHNHRHHSTTITIILCGCQHGHEIAVGRAESAVKGPRQVHSTEPPSRRQRQGALTL